MTDTPRRIQGKMEGRHLRKIAPVSAFVDEREPELRLGDVVRLNSGGPPMLVVDALPGADEIIVAYRLHKNGKLTVNEWPIGRVCVHRVRGLW